MHLSKIALSSLPILLLIAGLWVFASDATGDFDFAILGDRTGETVEGVWEEVWRQTNIDHPAFVVTVGDTIQGGDDRTAEKEWEEVEAQLAPYRQYRILFTPGNHDVWSTVSANAYTRHSKRALHYGFDFKQVHITVLDNSRTDDLSGEELAFLKADLAAHAKQPLKFVFSHRPAWILQLVLGNPAFPLHQIALRNGVRYVISGHIHQMLHFDLDGITYLSMASSGGHLRESKTFERGWFFEHTLVHVHGQKVNFEIKELPAPHGRGRVTAPNDWGAAGLVKR